MTHEQLRARLYYVEVHDGSQVLTVLDMEGHDPGWLEDVIPSSYDSC